MGGGKELMCTPTVRGRGQIYFGDGECGLNSEGGFVITVENGKALFSYNVSIHLGYCAAVAIELSVSHRLCAILPEKSYQGLCWSLKLV